MIFSEKIIYSEKVKNNRDFHKLIESVKSNKPIFRIFLIVINTKSNSLFNIMSTNEMFKKFYSVDDYIVVGVAYNKKDAFLLLKDIMEKYYEEVGSLDNIKENLSNVIKGEK